MKIQYRGDYAFQEKARTNVDALWQPNQISEVNDAQRAATLLTLDNFIDVSDFDKLEAFKFSKDGDKIEGFKNPNGTESKLGLAQVVNKVPHGKFKNFIPVTDVGGHSWVFGGTGTLAKEVSNLYGGNGGQSIRLQIEQGSGLNSTATTILPAPVDLSNAEYIEYSFYVKEYSQGDATQQTFYLFSSNPGTGDYFSASVYTKKPGWNIVRIKKSTFSPSGAPNWASIQQVRFRINSRTTFPGEIFCSKVQGIPIKANVATLAMTFDDGIVSQIEGGNILASRNIKGSMYMIAGLFDVNDYMGQAHYNYLKSLGHELLAHGATSPYLNWQTQRDAQGDALFRQTVKNEMAVLRSRGCDTRYASYPQGEWGDETHSGDRNMPIAEAVKSAGVEYIRCTDVDLDNPGYSYANYSSEFPRSKAFISGGFSFSTEKNLTEAKAYIDEVIDYGSTVVCYGHVLADIVDGVTWTHADYIDFCDYIVAKRNAGLLNIMSYSELCDSLAMNGMVAEYES